MLVTMKEILKIADEGGYAVGAFNVPSLVSAKAIIAAAEELNAVVIPGATIRSGISTPCYASIPFQQKIDDAATRHVVSSLLQLKEIDSMPYPLVYLTEAQQQRVDALIWDIGKYAEYHMVWFVTGDLELNDETWAEFCRQVEALGMDEMVSIWQTAYDQQR